jgi:hypothetical protein
MSANAFAVLSIVVCVAVVICRQVLSVRSNPPHREGALTWVKANPALVLCGLVPVLVAAQGVASGFVTSPNITDRNILVCSPFVWGFLALLFDAAFHGATAWPARAARLATALLILVSASIVGGRVVPRNEPYKESAAWIASLPACRNAEIPVIQADRKVWAQRGYTVRTTRYAYERYLGGYARINMLYLEDVLSGDIPASLAPELKARLHGAGCPVIGWSEHGINEQQVSAAGQAMVKAAGFDGSKAPQLSLKTFPIYRFSITWKQKIPIGYVIYVEHPGDSALAH